MSNKQPYQYILGIITALTVLLGVMLYFHPPSIFPDPSWGFQAMRSLQTGKGFNFRISPAIANVAQTNYDFLSWWSPGQYLLPYGFMNALNLNIGKSVAVTITACCLIGSYGFFAFFKRLGFTPLIAAISVAFIACQQAYFIPFAYYNGGEVLLFAFAGWFLYGCIYFDKVSIPMAIFVLLSGIIGFFCKSSFLWIYFAGVLFIWINISTGKKLINWLINGLCTGIPVILSLAIIYLTYLSKGSSPAEGADQLKLVWETFGFPLASPLLAAFSIDDLSGGILSHPIGVLISLALLSIGFVIYLGKNIPYKNYQLLLYLFYGVAVLFFGINFLRQANISYEARHMRLMGLIITPGIIYIVSKWKRPYQAVFGLIWMYIGFTSYNYVTSAYQRHYLSAYSSTGLAQEFIDQEALNYVCSLDKQEANAIFVFISPDIPLEIKNNRTITFDPLGDGFTPVNEFEKYWGHAGPLHIILPKEYKAADVQAYLRCFPGYSNFEMCIASKGYVIYTAR